MTQCYIQKKQSTAPPHASKIIQLFNLNLAFSFPNLARFGPLVLCLQPPTKYIALSFRALHLLFFASILFLPHVHIHCRKSTCHTAPQSMPSKDAQHNEGGFGESRNDNTNANKHLVVQGDQIGQFDCSVLLTTFVVLP